MLASPFPLSFLDKYNLSTSSLRCNALCMVISFLVLCSICLSSSLVHFRKGTTQLFIPLIGFLPESFVSSSFLVLLKYSFWIIIIIIIILFTSLSAHGFLVFHWSLSDTKSPQIFSTLLNCLADLNSAVIWIVSVRPLISNFSSLYYFLGSRFERIQVYFGLRSIFELLEFFFHVIYQFGFSVMFFLFSYSTSKLFCYLLKWVLVCPRALSTYLLIEFSFVILEYLVLFGVLDLVSESFKSPFRQYPLIYLFKLYCLTCPLLFFSFLVSSSQLMLVYFLLLSIFSYCRRFFINLSNLISHTSFVFLFGFLGRTLFLSLTSFAPV